MSRILITADWHLTPFPSDSYRWEIFPFLRDVLEEGQDIDRLYILGDLTDLKDNHPSALVNRVVREFRWLVEETGVDIVVLKGNHDYKDDTEPFFGFLSELDHVRMVTEPQAIGESFFIPHIRYDTEAFLKALKAGRDADYVFMHQTLGGSVASNGFKLDGLSTTDVRKALGKSDVRAYSGDIHVPQTVGPVTYVGSPYHVRFGDSFTPRMLILSDDGEEEIHMETTRRIKFRISDPEELLDVDITDRDQVKVELVLSLEDYVEWPELRDRVTQICETLGCELKGIAMGSGGAPASEDDGEEEQREHQGFSAEDPEAMFEEFCELEGLPDDIREVGQRIVEQLQES